MSKELLKLENELRNELPKYREKPKIIRIQQPDKLKHNIANFLDIAKNAKQKQDAPATVEDCDIIKSKSHVEMDIVMAQMDDSDE